MILNVLLMLFFLVVTPLSGGILYSTVMRREHETLFEIWVKGTVIMMAVFSFCYNAITRGAKPEKIHSWRPQYWVVVCTIICLACLCSEGYRFFRRMREKNKSIKIRIIDHYLIPVVLLAMLLFFLALLIIEPYEDGILTSYKQLCSGREITDILIDPIVSFYYTINSLTNIDAAVFITIIVPTILLLISVGCYDFIAERLSVPKEKRKLFLMLIYGMLIVTYMSRDYYLFGVYTNLWEPMAAFVSVFLPFQFGMMMYAMDAVNSNDVFTVRQCVFWALITGMLGYLFRYMDSFIVFAPALTGAAFGYLVNIFKSKGKHADT